MTWWRAHDEAVDDPKLQQLRPELFKAWFNLCCITSQNGGALPEIGAVAFKLRTTPTKAGKIIADLRAANLINETDGILAPHNWNGRQFKSDGKDPTNAARQKRFRDRHSNGPKTVTDTVTVTATRDRADTEQKEDAPSGAQQFAFESGRIRLNAKNLAQWKAAFVNLDLEAELLGLSKWAEGEGDNWFCAVSGALAKRNREIGVRRVAAQKHAPLTPAGTAWPDGQM